MLRDPLLRQRTIIVTLLFMLLTVTANAQLQSGNIFGRVGGGDAAGLPGVTVTLTGVGAPQSTVTDAEGDFRFINLSPGTYSLRAELAGFGIAERAGLTVNIGRNSQVDLRLAVTDVITVTAEAPLLDTRRAGTGATLTQVELENVPSARDPWVMLQQVPGVLMDRINIGGNESGQQSNFMAKGVDSDQATYSVDGVNTTDMIATGGSSAYYDFGSFEEIQVQTGSTDPRSMTPGAQINMVTKRGTNDFNGSGRYYLTPGDTQAEAIVPEEALGYLQAVNEIDEVTEWGFEAGGPIIRDRLWLWAAYADNKIDLFTAQPTGTTVRYSDRTSLETINAKLNAQLTRNNSATLFYYDNEKVKLGRDAGPLRPPETVFNQSGFGPPGTYKFEDTHVFSSNFYLTGLYSKVNGGFQLIPDLGHGCTDLDCFNQNASKSAVLVNATTVWRNTVQAITNERPQEQYRLDGSTFFSTGSLNHELKFGFGYRSAATEGLTTWANDQWIVDLGGGFAVTYFWALSPYEYEYEYSDLYVGDTMLFGNLTLQAGLRFDKQKGSAPIQHGVSNSTVPDWLPEMTSGPVEGMEWESISPRLGLTYALGQDKKTLLRAVYNRYVGQMGSNTSGFPAAIPAAYRYISFITFDENANDIITRDEIVFDYGMIGFGGFDPENPASNLPTTRIDPDVSPDTTDEIILGLEHELNTDLVVGFNYTHRQFDNFLWLRSEKTRGAGDYYTTADYELFQYITQDGVTNTVPTGVNVSPEVDPYRIPIYTLKAGTPAQKFFVLTNRDGYTQTYNGVDLSVTKRMANRWMMRGNISFNDHVQNVDAEAIVDPTRQRATFGCSVCDGSDVVSGSGTGSGAKGGVWINSKWAVNVAGVYQIPFIETNFGVNFTMRQGYPNLYGHQVDDVPTGVIAGTLQTPRRTLLLSDDTTDKRHDNPYSLDLRLAKDFRFRGVGLQVSLDAFNVTNERTLLQRSANLARTRAVQTTGEDTLRLSGANRISELQSPRILRLGARFTF